MLLEFGIIYNSLVSCLITTAVAVVSFRSVFFSSASSSSFFPFCVFTCDCCCWIYNWLKILFDETNIFSLRCLWEAHLYTIVNRWLRLLSLCAIWSTIQIKFACFTSFAYGRSFVASPNRCAWVWIVVIIEARLRGAFDGDSSDVESIWQVNCIYLVPIVFVCVFFFVFLLVLISVFGLWLP